MEKFANLCPHPINIEGFPPIPVHPAFAPDGLRLIDEFELDESGKTLVHISPDGVPYVRVPRRERFNKPLSVIKEPYIIVSDMCAEKLKDTCEAPDKLVFTPDSSTEGSLREHGRIVGTKRLVLHPRFNVEGGFRP